MLSPDHRVSYVSSIGQRVSVNPDHHQARKSYSVPHATEYFGTQWDPIAFRNTLLHVVHCSSYGPDDARGLTETCSPIELT